MSFFDFIKPVSTWSPEKVQEFLRNNHPDSLTLLDVRQDAEYRREHLPGAVHIPLAELEDRLDELDPGRPTVVYCTAGVRSRAAATVLARAGFTEVRHLAGGIDAWRGQRAEGLPEADLARFASYDKPEEHAALAWYLEEGTRTFYAAMAEMVRDAAITALFEDLTVAEEHHKATLVAVYEGLTGRTAPADFPHPVLAESAVEGFMEGGMKCEEAIEWARTRPVNAILELAMAVETNALDRYLHLHRNLPDENSRRVFEVLADEERRHLQRLAATLDHFV